MTTADLTQWLPIVLSAAALLYSIFKGQSRHTSEKFKAQDLKINAITASVDTRISAAVGLLDVLESRVTVVERDMTHLPDKDVTHRLEISLGKMESELGKLSERVKPLAAMADRMQEAMLEKVMG